MKQMILLLLSLIATAVAFQAPLVQQKSPTCMSMAGGSSSSSPNNKKSKTGNPMSDFLRQVTNNFQPFHGHGSLENDLDDQWEAQQEILRSRRAHHIDKDHLKKKYSDPSKVKFDGRVGDSSASQFGKNLEP